MTHLTDTTGTVNGVQECKDFVNMCNSKFTEVRLIHASWLDNSQIQYTLLTSNRIAIYRFDAVQERANDEAEASFFKSHPELNP